MIDLVIGDMYEISDGANNFGAMNLIAFNDSEAVLQDSNREFSTVDRSWIGRRVKPKQTRMVWLGFWRNGQVEAFMSKPKPIAKFALRFSEIVKVTVEFEEGEGLE